MTATDGLCRDYGPNAPALNQVPDICPSTGRPVAPEIVELARALKNDPNLMYEYVRNSVDTEFMFGAHKGAVGVIINHSGTAADQAELLVALFKQVPNTTANFVYGTATLNASDFQAWTGITDAQAACNLFATGGIPVEVNGNSTATSCAAFAGTSVNSVKFAHIWVSASVGGAPTYVYDPAFKPYQHKTGLTPGGGLQTAMGMTTGQPLATAGGTTGSDMAGGSSVPYAVNLAKTTLETKLQSYSTSLLTRLEQPDLQGADMTDVVGGRVIAPAVRPTGGWTQTSLSYVTPGTSIALGSSLPDAFRATVSLFASTPGSPPTLPAGNMVNASFFADEIYGRRLDMRAKPAPGSPKSGEIAQFWTPQLWFDHVLIQTGVERDAPGDTSFPMTITINHPFAGDGGSGAGSYGDAVITKYVSTIQSASIIIAWGDTSPNLATTWEREQAFNRVMPVTTFNAPSAEAPLSQFQPDGDLMRARVAASWLGQFTRETNLNAEIANSRPTTLHVAGVVMAAYNSWWVQQPLQGGLISSGGFPIQDEATSIDLEASFGLTSRVSDAATRRAAIHTIAAASAALEGGVIEQLSDTPDGASTARRFGWSAAPGANDTTDTTPRKYYDFTQTNDSNITSLVMMDNSSVASTRTNPVLPGFTTALPAISASFVTQYRGGLQSAITAYANAGFDVVAPDESFAGTGHRMGSEYFEEYISNGRQQEMLYARFPTMTRGGALVANLYDTNGDPVQIAHVITRYSLDQGRWRLAHQPVYPIQPARNGSDAQGQVCRPLQRRRRRPYGGHCEL